MKTTKEVTMLEKAEAYITKWNMLEDGDKVIVGISGGADSVCLILVLEGLRKRIKFDMIGVHINHLIRGADAEHDEHFVNQFCSEIGIPCITFRKDVKEIAKRDKMSEEEAGRMVRHELFRQVLKEEQGTKIALAHHQNDNAETLMMNLARGTGLTGLGGMHPVNGQIIRPLLNVSRREIEEYLQKTDRLFCEDETNRSDQYTRNRIRNHIISYLEEEVNPKAVTHISSAMEQVRDIQEYLERQMIKDYHQVVRQKNGEWLLSASHYYETDKVIRPLILRKILMDAAGQKKNIFAVHIKDIDTLMERQCGREIHLPYELSAVRCYEGICFRRSKSSETIEPVMLIPGREIRIDSVKMKASILPGSVSEADHSEKPYTKYFDYDIIKKDVSIRTRQAGDYITIDDQGHTQKLKAYFINKKIPREERNRILLAAEGNHVLWIIGYKVNQYYQVKSYTGQTLKIEMITEDKDGRNN